MHVAEWIGPLFLADMIETVAIKRADVSDVAIGRVRRDGRTFLVFGFDLLCPVLLVFQRDLARDLFQDARWFGDL